MSDADLVGSLRNQADAQLCGGEILKTAADRIEALAGEVERLRESEAELQHGVSDLVEETNYHREKRNTAERALAEAVEIMRPFASWIDAVEAFPTASFPDHASFSIGHETGDPQPTKITGADLRAARDFITAQEKEKGK